MTIQRLYQTAQATSDGYGNVTLTFPSVPQGLMWTGTITASATNPPPLPGSPPSVVAATPALRLVGATWTIFLNESPYLSYQGLQVVEDFQASDRQTVVIKGAGITPNTPVIATWSGFSDATQNVIPLGPTVSGIPGSNFANVGGPIFGVSNGNVLAVHGINNTFGTTVTLYSTPFPSDPRFMYLLGYTLGASFDQLSTVTGNRSVDVYLQFTGQVIDQISLTGVNTGTVDSKVVAHNFMTDPLPVDAVAGTTIDLVVSTSGGSAVKSWATVYIALV